MTTISYFQNRKLYDSAVHGDAPPLLLLDAALRDADPGRMLITHLQEGMSQRQRAGRRGATACKKDVALPAGQTLQPPSQETHSQTLKLKN
jgi:hypothetical protein